MTKKNMTIGIAGAGLIGIGWAASFAASGHTIRIWDIKHNIEHELRPILHKILESIWGICPNKNPVEIIFCNAAEEMVDGCDLIFESVAEEKNIKINVLAKLDHLVDPKVIICSSTSSMLLSEISARCSIKERVIIAHPFNPPYLIPLVELFGSNITILHKVSHLLKSIGKTPVILKKEMTGHIANRLTSAVFKEILFLIEQEVASIEDIDTCITEGPGLRWALVGPLLGYHLSGGSGGIDSYMSHLGPSQIERWKSLGTPNMSDDFIKMIINNVKVSTKNKSMDNLISWRDQFLQDIVKLKEKAKDSYKWI